MDIERLKEKRKGLRNLFTRHLTKIKNSLGAKITEEYTKDMKIEELSSLKDQLIEKMNELRKIDDELQSKINIEDIEADLIACEEYKDKGTDSKSKLERCLGSLYGRPGSEVQVNQPRNESEVSSENSAVFKTETKNVVKLPKLDITKFYGDCSLWLDFWNSYEVAIHDNGALSKIEKFTYLKSYLGGVALNAISGFSLTEKNYDASVQLLKERFGRTDVIISSHMHKLLLIDPVKSCSNVTGLRKMYDAIEVQIRSLQSLNVATGTYGNLLCPVILQKLPEELNLNYNRNRESKELFDISDLIEFIRKELEIRETSIILANPNNAHVNESFRNKGYQNYQHKYQPNFKRNENSKPKSTAAVLATTVDENLPSSNKYSYSNTRTYNQKRNNFSFRQNTGNRCTFCSADSHMTHDCALDINDRKKALMAKGLCFVCFQGHLRKFCKREQKCRNCNSLEHNSLICSFDRMELKTNKKETAAGSEEPLSLFCFERETDPVAPRHAILLQTFTAAVKANAINKTHVLHCMIDGGSTRTFVVREICKLLGLKAIHKEELIIYTFGGKQAEKKSYDIVELELCNVNNPKRKIKIEAVVIDSITLGQIEIPSKWIRNIALKRGIELADQGKSRSIQILIGSDCIGEILGETNIKISKRLVATDTIFGFVIQGRDEGYNCQEVRVNHLTVSNDELEHERIKRFWELETIGINPDKEFSRSDQQILETFKQNITYENKRYETRLLWKEDNKVLECNYENAKRRLHSLNRVFERNRELGLRYREIINEHLNDGIVEPLTVDLRQNVSTGYFMPHHAVVREEKDTTKVRIVFDASSKGKDKLSLNDCLDSGPNLNPDLLKIILKFRLNPIAFCADIQRAFLEVGIAREDRKFLRFLWIKGQGPNLHFHPPNVQVLQFSRVPFGVKCSPFLLAATIRFHLKNYEDTHKSVCDVLRDLYVDDLINGAETVKDAAFISCNATKIMKDASMNLRQWVTNSAELREIWNSRSLECRKTPNEGDVPLKVLGLVWDNVQDILKIALNNFEQSKGTVPTKRTILSTCGMIFDPLGLLIPFTIKLKLMMQELWEKGISWDEPLSQEFNKNFEDWISEARFIQSVTIPRLYFQGMISEVELHLFSDASPKVYGAVAYFRTKCDNDVKTSFVIAKSRLAPLKEISLPRLELLGTLIAARLCSYLTKTFPMIKENDVFLWTDSSICLHWIKGFAKDWKTFIKNRVCEIKEKTNPMNWHHCSGKTNPADKLTRGMSINTLINDKAWISGPSWLKETEIPVSNTTGEFDIEEVRIEKRKTHVLLQTYQRPMEPIFDLTKFNNLRKVARITAYVLRFVRNCKSRKLNSDKRAGTLSTEELIKAEKYWVHVTQQSEFEKEYNQLKGKLAISPESKIFSLNPSLDADGLICLGGRLQNSGFQFYEKHPMILPFKSKFTDLVIMNEHENVFHSGVSDTLTQIRERYWILRGRQAVKTCLNKCYVCKRFKAKRGIQVTAPLPINRIHEGNPFEITGVDFAGPLYTKDKDKTYIALFTCAVTRAVHLEVVSSLSSEHFLLAFRRFISRRGVCRILNSDNALTFKGADTELKKLYMNLKNSDVRNYFGAKGITWQYIVERAAWWGGYWERMVRMTKVILRKIIGRALVTFEELQTILAEIEAILNSRPLTYVYNESTEPFPLTPAHFLIGKRIISLPHYIGKSISGNVSSTHKVLIKRYLYRERLLNQFWKRWKREYLLLLKNVNFVKPVNVTSQFNVGDVVLIADDKLPRQMWKWGRVIEVHLGRDKQVRAVTLKTASGQIKRPIQLLYHMEIGKP